MLQTLITGLILTAVSGVTFLAYKHPKGYERLYVYLYWASTVIYLVVNSFIIGFRVGNHVAGTTKDDAATWIWIGWSCAAYTAIFVFTLFLRFGLPFLIEADQKNDTDKDESQKSNDQTDDW